MRFRHQQSPPPFLNRRDQHRMLAMVALLCMVVVAIRFAAQPANWNWFFQLDGPNAAAAPDEPEREPTLDDVDFRVKDVDQAPLRPDAVRVEVADDPGDAAAEPVPDGVDLDPELAPGTLANVEDNWLGWLRSERPALEAVVRKVRSVPSEVIEEGALDDVTFTVLMLDADRFRGERIHVEGRLKRLTRFPFGDPEDESDDLWEGWLFTPESGDNPYLVLAAEKPDTLKAGTDIDEPVAFTGYFFKRYGYAAQAGQHVAPLLIAKRLEPKVRPVVVDQRAREGLNGYVMVFVLVVAAVVLVLIGQFVISDRRFRGSRVEQLAESRLDASQEDLAALKNVPTVDPRDALRDLESESSEP
ncbi:MAG: hypothetical protein ACF8TS_06875 [Maioricimonas sp. JB049]